MDLIDLIDFFLVLASAQAKFVDVFILEETAECTVDIQENPLLASIRICVCTRSTKKHCTRAKLINYMYMYM